MPDSAPSLLHNFADGAGLAAELAERVAAALRTRIAETGSAALAVSGGTTPVQFFFALSQQILDWADVTITLVDDRCVPENSPRSNARLVRETLLQNAAAAAKFLPLVGADDAAITALGLPFAAVVLGMGTDGHTASFFPGGDHLAQALTGPHIIETMTAPGVPEPRITLTLPTLLTANFLAVHIEGAEKAAALEAALQPGPIAKMPIRAILARQPAPEIFWCP